MEDDVVVVTWSSSESRYNGRATHPDTPTQKEIEEEGEDA